MQKVYIVQVQGWGDDEDAMYNMSGHSTRLAAEEALENLLTEWENDGGNRDDVVHEIEVLSIDA